MNIQNSIKVFIHYCELFNQTKQPRARCTIQEIRAVPIEPFAARHPTRIKVSNKNIQILTANSATINLIKENAITSAFFSTLYPSYLKCNTKKKTVSY